ncbi:MAG: hypothetical protein Q8P12_05935 [bacterium]|nr:hypothetical protein [bacterium]
MVDPVIHEVGERLDSRFDAYSREAAILEHKLDNPAVPKDKRNRCRVRLEDLRGRLIPGVVRQMQGS